MVVLSNGRSASVQAQGIATWDNTSEGWTVGADEPSYVHTGYSTTTGVTNGTHAAIVAGTSGTNFGHVWQSPFSVANAATLSNAQSVSLDIWASEDFDPFFGNMLLAMYVEGGSLGETQIDDFLNAAPLGSQTTLTWNLTPAQRSAFALDTANNDDVRIFFRFLASNGGTMYLDNLRITPVPEPASLGLAVASGGGVLLARRRRRI